MEQLLRRFKQAILGFVLAVLVIVLALGAVELAAAGILTGVNILFELILLGSPLIAAYILPFVFGLFAIIGGIILIVFAFRLRKLAKQAAV